MKYQQLSQGDAYGYPNHDVPPSQKNAEWCLQYARAAYYDSSYLYPRGMFSNNDAHYQKMRMYALGQQPVDQYKRLLGVDANNNTHLVVDWSIRPIISQYRDKAISRLMKNEFEVVAVPIDALAQTEISKYYNELKAKIVVRDMLMQQNPEAANHPEIFLDKNEPQDTEELEMRVMFNEQFNRSKDAELAISLGMYENDFKMQRRMVYEDLFDFGVAAYKDWLGEDNHAKFKRVYPGAMIVSPSETMDFQNIVHAGELQQVRLVDLATVTDNEGNLLFTEKELQEFAGSVAGKFGNPPQLGQATTWIKPFDKFKCTVLDLYFYTYNEETYSDRKDKNNNTVYIREDSGRGQKENPRYVRKKIQYIYKVKWIVGTDKVYDWGMAYDQPRSNNPKKRALTRLPFTVCAYNFNNMQAQSFMDRLVPFADDYQLTMLKIQNFKNRAVPSGWWINLDMLENVAKSKGGAGMTPKELLQMFFDSGVLAGRSLNDTGEPIPGNVQPVIPISNTAAAELAMFYQDLVNIIGTIEKTVGYNPVTNGQASPKTLTSGYEAATQATEDSLYPMEFAEHYLATKLADNVLCRMQQGLKKGEVSGVAPYSGSLSSNTRQFLILNPEIATREYGVMLMLASTQMEREWVFQQVQIDIQNGFLDTSDAILIINTHNAKQAMQILAHRVKKAKEAMQRQKMMELQATNQANLQAQQMAAQSKQNDLMLAAQIEMEKKKLEGSIMLQETMLKLQSDERIRMYEISVKAGMNADQAAAKVEAAHIAGNAKVYSTQLSGEHQQASDVIKGVAALEKQKISNDQKKKVETD